MIEAQTAPPLTDNYFNAILCADGTVQTCGQNWDGQLGLGYTGGGEMLFQTVPGLTDVQAISVGGDHVTGFEV